MPRFRRYGRDYGREYRGYGRDYDRGDWREPIPSPWGGYLPPTYMGGGPIYGLEGGGWAPFEPFGYARYGFEFDYESDYRVPPEESPTFGEAADREFRRWARRHGHDEGYAVQPRGRRPGRAWPRQYGRGYRGGRGRTR